MVNMEKQSPSRFEMIKKRHKKTYEAALSQGKVDKPMESLCTFTAKTTNYYTSSCCSGRIMLLEKHGSKKCDNLFHRRWHRTVTFEELKEGVNESTKGKVWFKMEPFILHIGCGTIENAKKILEAMQQAGVKRGGIILAGDEKFLIEMQGTERMELIVKEDGKNLVSDEYLKKILETANPMLENNFLRLKKFEKEFKKVLD